MSTPDRQGDPRTPPLARPIDALEAVRGHPQWYLRSAVRHAGSVLENAALGDALSFLPPPAATTDGGETDGPSPHLQLLPDVDLSPAYDDAFSTLTGKLEDLSKCAPPWAEP